MTLIKQSAGIIVYRNLNGEKEFLLAHPGGPFNRNKDLGVWTIPKGGIELGEDIETAARREFLEETNLQITSTLKSLSPITMKSGKIVYAFAVYQDPDIMSFKSNTFEVRGYSYPEIDRINWFNYQEALKKIHPSQVPFINEVQYS